MSKLVLIVEDEDDNLTVITQIFEFILNHTNIIAARDGLEAIRKAYDHRPDLILMDLTLPKLSGWEATRSLKSDPQFKDTPVIALTADAMVGKREQALDAGCDEFFTKPVDIDRFVSFIEPYLL